MQNNVTSGNLPDMVARTEQGSPDNLNMYAADVHGPGAVVRAVRELRAGRSVAFAVCDRDGGEEPKVRQIVGFASCPGAACVRYVGEDSTPDGPGSSTVEGCGSVRTKGSVRDLDPVAMAAYITGALARLSGWYFLLA